MRFNTEQKYPQSAENSTGNYSTQTRDDSSENQNKTPSYMEEFKAPIEPKDPTGNTIWMAYLGARGVAADESALKNRREDCPRRAPDAYWRTMPWNAGHRLLTVKLFNTI